MTLLPSLQSTNWLVSIQPVEELRRKAEFPNLMTTTLPSDRGDFGRKLQSWYDDHYGFRDLLIKLKTQIDYSVFSKSDQVHIGKEGWLYYRSVLDKEKIQVERQPHKIMHDYFLKLVDLSRYLKKKRITLVILRIPLKDIVYPEFVPKTVPKYPPERNEYLLTNLLNSNQDIISIDVTEALTKLKPSLQVFHKTDFHWTDPAAFFIAQDLVNLLFRLEGHNGSHWNHEIRIVKKEFSGGQARFMPLLLSLKEVSIFNQATWPDSTSFEKGTPPFREILRSKDEGHRPLLPTTVVKGNSLFDAMLRSGVQNYFSALFVCNTNVRLSEVLKSMPEDTKYLIIQDMAGNQEYIDRVTW
jgi:hypothetical protein